MVRADDTGCERVPLSPLAPRRGIEGRCLTQSGRSRVSGNGKAGKGCGDARPLMLLGERSRVAYLAGIVGATGGAVSLPAASFATGH
jgi:hypothetical protein